MELKKRECPIHMELVPYGGGWTDVYVDFGDGELYFIISHLLGADFDTLMKALYHLYPNNHDYEEPEDLVDYKLGICEVIDGNYVVKRIVDDIEGEVLPLVYQSIPWKAEFTWDEEGSNSHWKLERIPDQSTSFMLKISIEINRKEYEFHEYEVRYEDMCYAVADACTRAIKKHGLWGYYHAIYHPDMNLRYLLLLKSIALNNFEARTLTFNDEKGRGESSDFQKELELLQFDMS